MKKMLLIVLCSALFLNNAFVCNAASLYGQLEKVGNGYSFTKFSTKHYGDAAWVDLADGEPTWSTASQKCQRGVGVTKVADYCNTIDAKKFRTFHTSLTKTLGWTIFSMGLGTGAILGEVKFDKDDYLKAIALAGGIEQFKDILDAYRQRMNLITKEHRNLVSSYQESIRSANIFSNITDNSGLYAKDINIKNLVHLEGNSFALLTDTVTADSPANIIVEIDKLYTKLKSDWLKHNKYVSVVCNTNDIGKYDLKIRCPDSVPIENGVINVPVNLVINNIRNIDNVFPSYNHEDKNLKVLFDGKRLHFVNKTDTFLTVKSISMYYGSFIKTLPIEINLAPQASTINPVTINDFMNNKLSALSSYKDVTLKGIAHAKLTFGFAIKYRVIYQNIDKTQYKTFTYNLYDLIALVPPPNL